MITDHAVIRYCERIAGVDMLGIRAAIKAEIGPTVARLSAHPITRGLVWAVRTDRAIYIIDGGLVVTVLPRLATPRLGGRRHGLAV